jgi:hypothetical protein
MAIERRLKMAEAWLDFVWELHEGGYEWVKTSTFLPKELPEKDVRLELFLTDAIPFGGAGFRRWRYHPLRLYSGLFRAFAETDPSPEGIRGFANEYGLLGVDPAMLIILPQTRTSDQSAVGTGESLDTWLEEICAMRQALSLWDMARIGDVKGLSRYIRWEGSKKVVYTSTSEQQPKAKRASHSWQLLADQESLPAMMERFRPGDLIQPALYRVQHVINAHLKGRVSFQLLWENQRTQLGLYVVPHGLIGALWLQFSRAIDGNKEYRRCRECKTWFEVAPDTARTNKRFCTDACRFKAYRKRQAEARRLYAKGASLEQIAQQLGTHAKTVQGWVAGTQAS